MSPINQDGPVDTSDAAFDAEDAFMKLWGVEDAEGPSKATKAKEDDEEDEGSETDEETNDDEGDDKSTDEDEGQDEGEEDGDTNDANVEVKDEFKVKFKVGDEEKEVSIGELKRLAGQEAALTRKSQEVATKRKTLDTQAATQVAALDRLLAAANKRFEPYKNLNFLALAKDPNISGEELSALQEMANAAHSDVRFLTQELGAFQQEIQKQRSAELREQAAETVKVLSDPEKGIEGFGEKMYGDMMSYAKTQGVTDEALAEIVDPISLRILHKAMLYDRGVATVKKETDPKTTSKKKAAPKKIVKRISNTESNREVLTGDKSDKEKAAMKRLRQTGSMDDVEAAFEARFSRGRD